MTNTETRLRDYLHSKAATIQDEPPPLTLPIRRHRAWPVVVAAAAIAAILVIAIPVAFHLSGKNKTAPPPADKPSNELRIPYTLSKDRTVPDLHDGGQTVPSASLYADYQGRVGGGWLIDKPNDEPPTRAGLLMPDGHFRPLGPPNSRSAVPSPTVARSRPPVSSESTSRRCWSSTSRPPRRSPRSPCPLA